jgi:hypothetical protein
LATNAGVDLLSCLAGFAFLTLLLQSGLLGGRDRGGLSGLSFGPSLRDGFAFGDASLANGLKFCGASLFAIDEVGVANRRLGFEFFEQSLLGRGCRFQAVGEFRFF